MEEIVLAADSLPASWQPAYEMQEQSILARGKRTRVQQHRPDLFYALGPQGYEEIAGTSTDSLAWYRHQYDKDAWYWLVWGGDFGAGSPM